MTTAAGKPRLLFLAHRIPYPPDKGDKIRSYNLLRHLADHFEVFLGTFVDDEDDWQYCAAVRQYCADACFISRRSRLHKLLSLRGLISGAPLSIAFYGSRDLQRWVDSVVADGVDRALLFCSPMAQFTAPGTSAASGLKQVFIDLVDVDSEKWRQYGDARSGPLRWVFHREASTLLKAENSAVERADAAFLVSEQEAALFRERAPDSASKLAAVANGVDTDYFRPDKELANPFGPDARALVFTGAMDYWPNVDAVTWFAEAVFPALRARHEALEFWIVGSKPTSDVKRLAGIDGIHVTGRVDDVRPYLQHAVAGLAPMRVARGIQNKVLECMAMARCIIASEEALEGIDGVHDAAVFCCKEKDDFVVAIEKLLQSWPLDAATLREHVRARYSWPARLKPISDGLLGR